MNFGIQMSGLKKYLFLSFFFVFLFFLVSLGFLQIQVY